MFPGRSLRGVQRINSRLKVCRSGKVDVRLDTDNGATYPVYEGYFYVSHGNPIKTNIPISGYAVTGPGGATVLQTTQEMLHSPDRKKLERDAVNNDPIIAAGKKPLPTLREAVTIEQETAELSKRWTDDAPLFADPAIASKRVCVFGGEDMPAADIASGIATLYGLRYARVVEGKPGGKDGKRLAQWRITTNRVRQPAEGEDVLRDVLKQIPPGLFQSIINVGSPDYPMSADTRYIDWVPARQRKMIALHASAMARLRAMADAALLKSGGKPVPLSDLPPEAKDYIAATSMITLLPTLTLLAVPTPDYVTHFSQSRFHFSVGTDPNEPGYTSIQYGIDYRANGHGEGGSGNLRMPNDQWEQDVP